MWHSGSLDGSVGACFLLVVVCPPTNVSGLKKQESSRSSGGSNERWFSFWTDLVSGVSPGQLAGRYLGTTPLSLKTSVSPAELKPLQPAFGLWEFREGPDTRFTPSRRESKGRATHSQLCFGFLLFFDKCFLPGSPLSWRGASKEGFKRAPL